MTPKLTIIGSHGSPYSMKMLSILRYRHIPYAWKIRQWGKPLNIPPTPVNLIPIIILPNTTNALIDSTPIIRELEKIYAPRSIIPPRPALRFLDALLEDYGDEWMTKAMFYYRWSFQPDIEKAKTILPQWSMIAEKNSDIQPVRDMIAKRQISRLEIVGCNKTTAPVIEESYEKTLAVLNKLLQQRPFIMGERPGTADFGIYGQLSQLTLFDPTSSRLAFEKTPRVLAWSDNMSDLSGLDVSDSDWLAPEDAAPRLKPLLSLVGTYYAPFLLANAAALQKGARTVRCEIAGREWVQNAFPYQGKCLKWLREDYASLTGDDKNLADQILAETGAETLFQ